MHLVRTSIVKTVTVHAVLIIGCMLALGATDAERLENIEELVNHPRPSVDAAAATLLTNESSMSSTSISSDTIYFSSFDVLVELATGWLSSVRMHFTRWSSKREAVWVCTHQVVTDIRSPVPHPPSVSRRCPRPRITSISSSGVRQASEAR